MGLYCRQNGIELPQKVAVIGCGGTGTWAALIAAMAGVPELVLVDHDAIEESNLNRLPYDRSAIGKAKVDVLRELINRLRPETSVTALRIAVDKDNLPTLLKLNKVHVVFDCTDKFHIQRMLHSFTKSNHMDYVRCGCTLDSSTVSDFVSEWGDAPDGYQVVPSWAVTATIAGALGVALAAKRKVTVATTQQK